MNVYREHATGRLWVGFHLAKNHRKNSWQYGFHLFAGLWYGRGTHENHYGKINGYMQKRPGPVSATSLKLLRKEFRRVGAFRPARFLKMRLN